MEVTGPLKTLPYQHPPYLCGMGDVGMEVVGMGVGIHVLVVFGLCVMTLADF